MSEHEDGDLARLFERVGSSRVARAIAEAPGDIFQGFRNGVAWLCETTGLPAYRLRCCPCC